MSEIVIDVSQYNCEINWSKVDVDEVYIRVGYRGYTVGKIKQDIKFLTNVKGAINAGIKVGLYFMSQAINSNEAIEEAEYVVNQIKEYDIILPIFYDSELSGEKNNNGRADKLSKSQRTANCVEFCKRIVELGYKAGIYASTSWFKANLDISQLLDYYIWVAQYSDSCTATHKIDIWQYTSKGLVSGISGNVDISKSYTDIMSESIEQNNNVEIKVVNYKIGTYKLTSNLKVREGAGTNFNVKKYSQLTANAKAHSTAAGILKSGTKVNVSEIIENKSDVWGKIPSGYIALYYEGKRLAVEC